MTMKNVALAAMMMLGAVACATGPEEDDVDGLGEETAEGGDESVVAAGEGDDEEAIASTEQGVSAACSHGSTREIGAGCCSFLWSNQKKQKQMCVYGAWYNTGGAFCSKSRCGRCSAGKPC